MACGGAPEPDLGDEPPQVPRISTAMRRFVPQYSASVADDRRQQASLMRQVMAKRKEREERDVR